MTEKTENILSELTEALFEKKAVLITGNTGVGKTYLAKEVAKRIQDKKYSCYPKSMEQDVRIELVSCHNSVTYEDVVGGITVGTTDGEIVFEYKDKILIEMLIEASNSFELGNGKKYVLILDDLQRNDISMLLGDAVKAIGDESGMNSLYLNAGKKIKITPNFYVIGTYNATEIGAVALSSDILGKFYVREILSDIEYITENRKSENAVFYEQVRGLIMNYLDMQYRMSTYEQNRYLIGHGYFSGNNVSIKIKYQLIPILKQYMAEGIIDVAAEDAIRLLDAACAKKKQIVPEAYSNSSFDKYKKGVTTTRFMCEDSTRQCSSIPIENLVGRIIEQRLLTDVQIKNAILFNKKVCYREIEVGGVTYQAMLIANSIQHNKIRRGGKSTERCLYNGGTILVDGSEHYFTGGFHPKDYVKSACWENTEGYKLGESFGGNLVLFRIVWQYYQTLVGEYTQYLKNNPLDIDKKRLLEYIKTEWNIFLNDFKKIEPKSVSKLGRADKDWKQEEAIYNLEANEAVRKLIASLKILWSNPGDRIIMEDGSEITLEGADNDMGNLIYKEYKDTMETLGIKQMILQGPPGTSKTYSAKEFLKYMAHDCSEPELADMQIADYAQQEKYCAKLFKGKGEPDLAWDIVQFHPSYGYEDFIRGIKVSTKLNSDTIMYETVNKVLGNISELAINHPKTNFFLVIDEINRANLATVFGELIYGLEYRNESVATPYAVNNNNRISIPDNLYIIGTMNTADKSIGGIDYAIRRRFLFFEQLPDENVIRNYKSEDGDEQIALNEKAIKLFRQVANIFQGDYLSSEYRCEDVQIGHTYFLVDSEDKLLRRFEYQIIPILKEYYKDGIISFTPSESIEGFMGFMNCIAGKINMTSQKEVVEKIFKELIV
jgi:MoxR-like ATPase